MVKYLKPVASALALLMMAATPSTQAALPFALNGQQMPTLAPMLEQVTPTVVHIATQGRAVSRSPMFDDPFFEHFFGSQRQQERRTQGLGSGVIIDAANGYIITNSHVIEDAEVITVTLRDGRTTEANLVGADPDADIAVLKIGEGNLSELPFSDSEALRVGDFVVAIGNPFGLKQTVTSGIVSGLGRSGLGIESYENFIQTDASINPGNSGGALVNLRGELVGINTAILGPNGGNIGIGFAIPINMAKAIADQLVQHGEVSRGRLGVGIQDLTPKLARAFGLENRGGAVVSQVEHDSPAHMAGIEVGDVIVGVNGVPIRDASRLRNSVGLLRVDSKVTLDIVRDGREIQILAVMRAQKHAEMGGKEINERLRGATFEDVAIDGEKIVIIGAVETGSPAARAGLREGDIILSVNRQSVRSVAEASEAASGSNRLLLNIVRDGRGLFVLIQ